MEVTAPVPLMLYLNAGIFQEGWTKDIIPQK